MKKINTICDIKINILSTMSNMQNVYFYDHYNNNDYDIDDYDENGIVIDKYEYTLLPNQQGQIYDICRRTFWNISFTIKHMNNIEINEILTLLDTTLAKNKYRANIYFKFCTISTINSFKYINLITLDKCKFESNELIINSKMHSLHIWNCIDVPVLNLHIDISSLSIRDSTCCSNDIDKIIKNTTNITHLRLDNTNIDTITTLDNYTKNLFVMTDSLMQLKHHLPKLQLKTQIQLNNKLYDDVVKWLNNIDLLCFEKNILLNYIYMNDDENIVKELYATNKTYRYMVDLIFYETKNEKVMKMIMNITEKIIFNNTKFI